MATYQTTEMNEAAVKSKSFINKSILKYLVWIGIMALLIVIVNVI